MATDSDVEAFLKQQWQDVSDDSLRQFIMHNVPLDELPDNLEELSRRAMLGLINQKDLLTTSFQREWEEYRRERGRIVEEEEEEEEAIAEEEEEQQPWYAEEVIAEEEEEEDDNDNDNDNDNADKVADDQTETPDLIPEELLLASPIVSDQDLSPLPPLIPEHRLIEEEEEQEEEEEEEARHRHRHRHRHRDEVDETIFLYECPDDIAAVVALM
jgi:hypothetical protein